MINDSGIVVGVEHIKQLYDMSIKNICKHHKNLLNEQKVILDNCDGRMGYKKYAPYKAIHVGAAAPSIPDELINQLDFNGRMFIPVGGQNEAQWIYIIDKDLNGNLKTQKILSVCYVPLTSVEKQLYPQNK